MRGENYIAVRRLSTKGGGIVAEPGDRCARVPVVSLEWLLERGWIRPAPRLAPRRIDP